MPSGTGHRRVPNATGTFADLPIAHALVYIRAKRLSGVLDLRAPGGRQAWVVFWRGAVASVSTQPTVARFGTVAYEMGVVDAQTIDETASESAKRKKPQAEILLERGDISQATYKRVLEEQMRRRVHHLFTYPSSTIFLFREGRTSTTTPALFVDLLGPVWRGITDYPPNERIEEVLGALGKRPIKMTSEAVLELAGLTREEELICEALSRGAKSRTELHATVRAPAQRIDLLVYLLLVSRCAEPVQGASAAPSSAMWSAVIAPQPSRSGEIAKSNTPDMSSVSFARESARVRGPRDVGVEGIKRRATEIADEGPFEALGLEDGASLEAARAAFVRLQHMWNPDRLPVELESVRREVTSIYEHIVDAHRTLTDPRNRAAGS